MKYQQSGCLRVAKLTDRLGPSAETVECVWETFVRSPQKSTHRTSQELHLPQSNVWRILCKCLREKGYLLQLLQALNPQDRNLRLHFCMDFQQRLEEDRFAEKLVFSDEAMFHVCGKVNHHNVHIWGMENSHATMEHVRDLPKVNVFCAISSCKVYGLFFLAEPSVTSISYLDMLQLWLMPQLQENSEDFIFQQDRTLPHFHFDVCAHLNANLPGRWVRFSQWRSSSSLACMVTWPNHLLFFFLWGYVKDCVYVPPMPRDLPQLRQRIMEAVAAIDRQMLQCVWQELDYRISASQRVDISSSTCKVGQKLGVSLPLLTCFPSAWPSQLLYHRGQKSWRDLRITLYFKNYKTYIIFGQLHILHLTRSVFSFIHVIIVMTKYYMLFIIFKIYIFSHFLI